jgi:hypothetical protein
MPEHVDRLGDIERGWTIYCDDQGAVEALRRGKPLQGNAPEPVSHGWVTVFFRPVDWRVLDRLRGER